uniref:Matrix remodeling associated 5 n=1 Tax=Sander lucioperca TaxID=283035 RepID=A0A8C9XA85_SANLU
IRRRPEGGLLLDDGTLVVQKVQRFDDGNYTCMSRNNAGQDHKVIRLEVLVTSPMINGLKGTLNAIKVTAVADQRTLVDCIAEGMPIPRIMWVLPGNVILPAPYYSNRMTVHPNGTLEIRLAKRTDSGQLACIARNEGGEVKLIVNLDIKEVVERAQIRGTNTDNLSLTVGNAVTLNCSFEGSTLPHVTWILPNGTPLHSGAQFSKFFHRPNDGSLIISNPSIAEAGMYRCLGRNSRGLVERTFTLSPGKKPEIINRYNSPVSVVNGEGLLLHCLTNAKPFRLTWTLPSGVVLNRPQRAGRYAVLANGTLSIHQVSVYDRGLYGCRAANEYGSSQLSVSVIVMAYPPRITNGPPSVTYAKHGVAVQLNCVATGIPRVEVAWETPDKTRLAVSAQPRLFGNKYLHPQGSLVIQNPTQRDAGVYRCTARNAIGKDSKATILNVVAPKSWLQLSLWSCSSPCYGLLHPATLCSALLHTATSYYALQCPVTSCYALLHTATSCYALQCPATPCNALHCPATPIIFIVTIIATVHHIPNQHRQTPPTKSLGLSEVSP